MSSRETLRNGGVIAARLAQLVTVAGLLIGTAVSASAQNRRPLVPGIGVPTTTVTPTIAAPVLTPTPITTPTPDTTTVVVPRVVGTQPDPSSVVPNTRVMLQQNRGGELDDNFLTEDWGKGRDRYGVRVGGKRKRIVTPQQSSGGGSNVPATAIAQTALRDVLIVVDGTPTDAQVDALAQRHRLRRIESQSFPMLAATVFRWRIPDNRALDRVLSELSVDRDVRFAQANKIYHAQDAGTKAAVEGDAGQYALAKLHLPEAHVLARGTDVAIAVIDSGIDVTHPELAGAIIGTYDALNSKEGAHPHGTGVAGTIVAHSRLVGGAPAARILAIRAFAANPSNGAESVICGDEGVSYAVQQNAQIINMSFAGPADPLVQQALGMLPAVSSGCRGPQRRAEFTTALSGSR